MNISTATSHYDEAKANHAIQFIENLSHTKGEWHGQRFILLVWQKEIVRNIFGVIRPDGFRQFNTAYVEIGKKGGKTELAAAIALYMLVADGERGAEIYSCAADRVQTSLVYMVGLCPLVSLQYNECWYK